MEFMLVLQLSGSSLADYDELIELEDAVRAVIEDAGTVDGHDIGSGERNIFIFTKDPKRTFEVVVKVFQRKGVLDSLRAGFRVVGDDAFTPLYPPDLASFAIK